MSETFQIPRTKQCAKCPWRVSTNPNDIPDGYCQTKHADLSKTISSGIESLSNPYVMACHHSDGDDKMFCVGWLHNQLGSGNNIGLRMKMRNCSNLSELKVYGAQHETFEQTLP